MGFTWSSGAKLAFRLVLLPSPRAPTRAAEADRVPLDTCALALHEGPRPPACRTVLSRAGKIPIEVTAPGRSPLPSATLEHVAVPRPSRTLDRSACHTFPCGSATLLTLRAVFPVAPGPCDPAHTGFPLMGLSKDRPSIVFAEESVSKNRCPLRRRRVSLFLRDGKATSHPRSVPVVSHHLDGLLLLDPATVFQAAADPGVHRVSSCRETGFPAMQLPPFEAFPPPTAADPRIAPVLRGSASPLRPFPAVAFTAHLAPSPFFPQPPLLPCVPAVSRRFGRWTSG
jgi:hypothetical protein